MREVGYGGLFPAPDHRGDPSIHASCQEWLLEIELDLSNSEHPLEAVKWAISELLRIEGQLLDPVRTDEDAVGGIYHGVSSYSGVDDNDGSREREQSSVTSQPRLQSDDCADSQKFVQEDQQDATSSSYSKKDPEKIDLNIWRRVLNATYCCDGESTPEGERGTRGAEFQMSNSLRKAVIAAEGGKGGKRMSERINSRLQLAECTFLMKLVGHCLLVSLDQVPAKSVREALFDKQDGNHSDWMWLHRWLVGTLLSGDVDDTSNATLDWLVAYMTLTRSTITKLVLDDLVADLRKCETGEQPHLANYIRQTGVLEYAALRSCSLQEKVKNTLAKRLFYILNECFILINHGHSWAEWRGPPDFTFSMLI